jgi:transcriptional regulator with XRE-family HTH domain
MFLGDKTMETRKSRRGPKPRKVTDPVCIAIRELREAMGWTQQVFAHHMKTAIRTVARWETVQPPKAFDTLSAFAHLAVKNDRYDLIRSFLPSPTVSIMVDMLKGSPELFSGLLQDPELSVLFDAVADESFRKSEPRYAEICKRITERIADLTTQDSRRKVWEEAIKGALQLQGGPRWPEVAKALDIFAARIHAIQRDLRASSISAESTQDPGKVELPEGDK